MDLNPAIDGSVNDSVARIGLEQIFGDLPDLSKGRELGCQVLASTNYVRPASLSFQALERASEPILGE